MHHYRFSPTSMAGDTIEQFYEQIGGADAVNAAVDIIYRRVLTNPVIIKFFGNVNMDGQIAKQKVFLTMAFGGPNNYNGKDLREAHKHMNITDEHLTALPTNLQSTLVALNVPENLISQVMAIAASTHDDVLNL